jgi:hypothetical protein
VHADAEAEMQPGQGWPSSFAMEHQRPRLAFPPETHDPVETDGDRRTADGCCRLPCGKDHMLGQLGLLRHHGQRHVQEFETQLPLEGEVSAIMRGDRTGLFLRRLRRTDGEEEPVSLEGVAPRLPRGAVAEIQGYLLAGIAGSHRLPHHRRA